MIIAMTGSARRPQGVIVQHGGRWLPVAGLAGFEDVARIGDLGDGRLAGLAAALDAGGDGLRSVDFDAESAASVADRATDIWGAGLNYLQHSQDLAAQQPESGPGSYLRPGNCLIDNGGTIELPTQSRRVTGEAELGLVIGTTCKNVARTDWRSVILGVTAVLDLTAEDVIRENPRYIPWAKGFDTFCSIGPVVVTLDEFDDSRLKALRIATVKNGQTIAEASPSAMKYDLSFLVEYFSAGRTLEAGTVICTGTPGAVPLDVGDTLQAVVEQVGTLTHPVRQG